MRIGVKGLGGLLLVSAIACSTLAALPACSSITAATFSADGGWLGTTTFPASCVKLMTDCPDVLPPG